MAVNTTDGQKAAAHKFEIDLRTQEVLYRLQPDVIVETGIAHGGSLVFYASLCKAMGRSS